MKFTLACFMTHQRNTLGVDSKMYQKIQTDFLALWFVNYIEYELYHEKTCAYNKDDTDQLVGLHNLISVCVDHCQNTIINSV